MARNLAAVMSRYYKKIKEGNYSDIDKRMDIRRTQYLKDYKRILEVQERKGAFDPGNISRVRSNRYRAPYNRIIHRARYRGSVASGQRDVNRTRYRGSVASGQRNVNRTSYRRPFALGQRNVNRTSYRRPSVSRYPAVNRTRYRRPFAPRYPNINQTRYRGSDALSYRLSIAARYHNFDKALDASRYFNVSRDRDFNHSRYGDIIRPRKGVFPRSRGSYYDRFTLSRESRPRWSNRSRSRNVHWSLQPGFNRSRSPKLNGTHYIEINGTRYRDLAEFQKIQRIKFLKGAFRPINYTWFSQRTMNGSQYYRPFFTNRFNYSRNRAFDRPRYSRFNGSRASWPRSGNGTRYIEINGSRYRNLEVFERIQRLKQMKGVYRPGMSDGRYDGRDFFGIPIRRNFSSRAYKSNFSRGAGRRVFGGGAGRPGGYAGRPGGGPGRRFSGGPARRFGGGPGRRGSRGGPGRFGGGAGRGGAGRGDFGGRRQHSQDYTDDREFRRMMWYGSRSRYGRKPRIIEGQSSGENEPIKSIWWKYLDALKLDIMKEEGKTFSPEELARTTKAPKKSEYEKYQLMNKVEKIAALHDIKLHVHFTPRAVPRKKWNGTRTKNPNKIPRTTQRPRKRKNKKKKKGGKKSKKG
ncbi:hypothetical protein WDU94_004160 [Cyamophila willieti]